jgi:hypothetical protein
MPNEYGRNTPRSLDPMANCEKHPFDPATGMCKTCRLEFCGPCLVFPFGPKKPALCIDCALMASGVRRHSARGRAGMFGHR